MNWLHTAAIVVHVLIATGIVGLVLLQRGKGADAGAGFGAGASGTVFGARGSASFLSRTTATLAALFFATSLALAYLSGNQPDTATSVVDRAQTQSNEAPALPDAPPAVDVDTAQQQIEAPAATTPASTQEQNK